MYQALYFPFRSIAPALTLILLLGAVGAVSAHPQEAAKSRPVLDFEGNKIFAKQELLGVANGCLDRWADKPYDTEMLDYCLHVVTNYVKAKGYLQASLDKPKYEQTESGSKALIRVVEGALFRVGKLEVKNAKILAPAQILEMIGLKPGDIANGEKLSVAIYQRAKEVYGNLGYIQYVADVDPRFNVKEGAEEGVVDFAIYIDEGQQFKIRSIKFAGGDQRGIDFLRRELMIRDGEVFNHDLLSQSIARMNNTALFDQIDLDKDLDFKTNEETGLIDLTIRLRKRIAASR